MKKFLLYILIIPALAVGCSSDPEVDDNPNGGLSVNATSLEFPSSGGRQVLEVKAEDIAQWEAYSNISWIKIGEPDFVNGTIEVTVEPTEEIQDLEGRIVIHSNQTDVVNISVKQKGLGIIHDRSWLSRMNLRGPVETIDCFLNPFYIWEADSGYMWDVKVNKAGNPTNFVYWKTVGRNEDDGTPIFDLFTVEVTYDSKDRFQTIRVDGGSHLGDGNRYEFTVSFVYGHHGKYIETEHLFLNLTDTFWLDINHRILLPAMMKDLVRIDIWTTGLVPRDHSVVFELDGDTASSLWVRVVDDEYRQSPLFDYEFVNGYSNLNYIGSFLGVRVPYQFNYYVDPSSGNIQNIEYYYTDDFILYEKKYHDDLQNSIYYFYDGLWTFFHLSVEYDDNYNIKKLTETYWPLSATFEYGDYDQYGNWTKIDVDYTGSTYVATIDIPSSRGITYYE